MVPKKLHYCWLSGLAKPRNIRKVIASWQRIMPDYELICWDCERFDIKSHRFVSEAYQAKKWAFAADYIRLHALHTEGGVYLDTDVIVRKSFDPFLDHDFFTAVEFHQGIAEAENAGRYLNPDGSRRESEVPIPGIGIQAAILGGVPGHPFLKDCLDYYRDRRFLLDGGGYDDKILAPAIFAMTAEKYGFKYRDEQQVLPNNMTVFRSQVFAGLYEQRTEESFAIHCCHGSWRDKPKVPFGKRVLRKLKSYFTK